MLKNYFKIALRNIIRNKVFSVINISGMAIGLSSCLVIALFIADELQYDRYHSKHERIFRLTSDLKGDNGISALAATPAPWAPLLANEIPLIENYARILQDDRALVGAQNAERFYENNVFFSDAAIFDIFDFEVTLGNAKKSLTEPNTAVITTSTAKKYFGDADPIGKTLQVVTAYGQDVSAVITAVTNDVAEQSHFRYNILVSMASMGDISGLWPYHMFHTYLLLKTPESRAAVEEMLPAFAEKYINHNPLADGEARLLLQPLTDIHLHSNRIAEVETNGDITYVYVLSGIAMLILVLACFNFMNLSTVHSLLRGKEVGLRKSVGAKQGQLIRQFLGEAVLLTLIAAFVAVIITQAVLPFFNSISHKHLSVATLIGPYTIPAAFGFLLLIAIVTGAYPALVLSSFKPAEVLKGKFQKTISGNAIRKTLVTFQFVISISLVACTITLYKQLDFVKNKDLGFNQSQVVILTIPRGTEFSRITAFENTLRNNSSVIAASASSNVPSAQIPVNLIRHEGSINNENRSMEMIFSDHDFIKTLGMQIVAGRDFSVKSANDAEEAFIINEQAVKELGWESPQEAIGKQFQWVLPSEILKSGKIIGVTQDFNFKPLNLRIKPLVIHIRPQRLQYLYVSLQPGSPEDHVKMLEAEFKKSFASQPFEFTFLDQTLRHLYENEQRLGKIFTYASALAIVIALLGIFALSMHSAKQRIKEVGIRKVLGASLTDIVKLSTREFIILVLLANIFALPIAWYVMEEWLGLYAYRISMDWTIIATSGLLVFSVAVLTVSFEAVKAAMSNPVNSLRNE